MSVRTALRQGQLVTTFGVGGLHVNSDGVSLVTAGLDYWFSPLAMQDNQFRPEEFRIEEVRLQKLLGVDFFYLPPDFRRFDNRDKENVNKGITIPVFRFPRTYFCQKQTCRCIQTVTPIKKEHAACPKCQSYFVAPMPLVAICDHGHAQEFPWNEWVHKSASPNCSGDLVFQDSGTPGLRGLSAECKKCGAKRDLSSVTSANNSEDTSLSSDLDSSGTPFLCRGHKPWLYNAPPDVCNRPLRASLRSASNLYFPVVRSAIHIPAFGISKKLQKAIENNQKITAVIDFVENVSITDLKSKFHELSEFSDSEIQKAITFYKEAGKSTQSTSDTKSLFEIQHELRLEEYEVLSSDCNTETLKVRKMSISQYGDLIQSRFETVCLVEKLRETRALTGFTRVNSETSETSLVNLQNLMRLSPAEKGERWLPANIIFGEGIFLKLNGKKLKEWEDNNAARAAQLSENYSKARRARNLPPKTVEARFVLIHTLAHLLMNKLTYEAGYSTASLRERLYVSKENGEEMYGLLIYTAAGDSDGTMGGLVHLGEPGQLDRMLSEAIEDAEWCSADPVCMETGDYGGQGPDNCNLAACHNCALVPETACEEFNKFLDRGMIVGSEKSGLQGFFK